MRRKAWFARSSARLIIKDTGSVTARRVGRFLSVDPKLPEPGDLFAFSRYAYAANNPHKFVDPDGRAIQALWGAHVGFAVDIAAQKAVNPEASINWKSVWVSTAVGAASGGVASLARVAAVRGSISIGRAIAVTGTADAVVGATGVDNERPVRRQVAER